MCVCVSVCVCLHSTNGIRVVCYVMADVTNKAIFTTPAPTPPTSHPAKRKKKKVGEGGGSWLRGYDYCSPLDVYPVITAFVPWPGAASRCVWLSGFDRCHYSLPSTASHSVWLSGFDRCPYSLPSTASHSLFSRAGETV